MTKSDSNASGAHQTINVPAGGQVVVNGALITLAQACSITIAPGAYALAGSKLDQARVSTRNPSEELYFSLLEIEAAGPRSDDQRVRLFGLLSEVAAKNGEMGLQSDCTACAAALMMGNLADATSIASQIALHSLVEPTRKERGETKHRYRNGIAPRNSQGVIS